MSVSVERLPYKHAVERSRSPAKCSATNSDPASCSRGERCRNSALYRVNGTLLCRRHAGSVVLDLLAVEVEPETEFWGS